MALYVLALGPTHPYLSSHPDSCHLRGLPDTGSLPWFRRRLGHDAHRAPHSFDPKMAVGTVPQLRVKPESIYAEAPASTGQFDVMIIGGYRGAWDEGTTSTFKWFLPLVSVEKLRSM